MKTLFTFLIFWSLPLFCQENDLQKLGLKGNIKSISYQDFYVITQPSGEIVKGEKNNFMDIQYLSTGKYILFNNNGNKIESNLFDKKTIYVYENGKLISTKKDNFTQWTFTYDNNNNQIEAKQFIKNELSEDISFTKSVYDKQNNLIKVSNYFNDVLSDSFTFKYDIKKKRIESNHFDFSKKLVSKSLMKYDKLNNLIETIDYNDYNNFSPEKTIYHYDKFKNVKITSNKIDYTYEYFYDDNNNWIKVIEFENNTATKITEREIFYFD